MRKRDQNRKWFWRWTSTIITPPRINSEGCEILVPIKLFESKTSSLHVDVFSSKQTLSVVAFDTVQSDRPLSSIIHVDIICWNLYTQICSNLRQSQDDALPLPQVFPSIFLFQSNRGFCESLGISEARPKQSQGYSWREEVYAIP